MSNRVALPSMLGISLASAVVNGMRHMKSWFTEVDKDTDGPSSCTREIESHLS